MLVKPSERANLPIQSMPTKAIIIYNSTILDVLIYYRKKNPVIHVLYIYMHS